MRFRTTVLAIATLFATLAAAQAQQPQPNNYRQQYSNNEIIDAGHRFFGTTSRELALLVERATSRSARRLAAPSAPACATGKARFTPATPATAAFTGRARRSDSTSAAKARA